MKTLGLNKVTLAEPSTGREKAIRAREDQLNFAAPATENPPRVAPGASPRNEKIDEVAKMYEKQFLREMVKAMRGTVSDSGLVPQSMGEKIYRSQMDEEYVEQWGNSGGVGMSDMIYTQIMDRYFKKPDAAKALGSQGPLKITNRDIARALRLEGGRPQQTSVKVEVKNSGEIGQGAAQVQVPWDATLVTKTKLPDGKNAVVLDHGSGLRSTFIFEGVSTALEPGAKLQRGTSVGVLSPDMNSFLWNMTDVEAGSQPAKNTGEAVLVGPEKQTL